MAFKSNIGAFRARQNIRASKVRKLPVKTASEAATFMQRTARLLAPRDSGEVRRGIKKTGPHGRGKYRVVSDVPGSFKQNLWANQTAPFRTLHFRGTGSGMAARTEDVVYGDGTHRITGTPRFWHFATVRTRAKFVSLARANLKSALRVTI